MSGAQRIREASHAGTWYSHDKRQLIEHMEKWSTKTAAPPSRFAIGPHAGYRFCGPVLAHSYAAVVNYHRSIAPIQRVVLMGPSHFKYFRGIQTTAFDTFNTPVGQLAVDSLARTIVATAGLKTLDASSDVREHSWEMHCPFIAHYLPQAAVLPLLFGAGSENQRDLIALLAPLVEDPHTAFVVSSDFCHWGESFDYTPFAEDSPTIYRQIEKLDRRGCTILQSGSSRQWNAYIDETQNTVCGAKPISWLLRLVETATPAKPLGFQLLSYDQSSRARTLADMSVSYAALVSSR